MAAFSTDLRQRVVAAYDAGESSQQQIADRFKVSYSWVRKILRHRRNTGSIEPLPHGGGHTPVLDEAACRRLRDAVKADNDATLAELEGHRRRLQHHHRVPGAAPPGAAAKKKFRRPAEQDRPELKAERDAWRAEFAAVDPARLVFVDESGATTAMDRTHGRAPSGVRVDGPVPHGHWKTITLTAAVRLDGVPPSACLAFGGATNTTCFEGYVGRYLVPALRPGDIVVMDNLSCHKSAEVARLIGTAGAVVRYLPAYSPDYNPIEQLFSKLKAWLRSEAARTVDRLIEAMGEALRSIRPSDIRGLLACKCFI